MKSFNLKKKKKYLRRKSIKKCTGNGGARKFTPDKSIRMVTIFEGDPTNKVSKIS